MSVRFPEQTVPRDFAIRSRIREAVRDWTEREKLIPPQTLDRLQENARRCLESLGLQDRGFDEFTLVMLNNALWEKWLPKIPADQRLLLLPFCLRSQPACDAARDDLGLICDGCGRCDIPGITEQAEKIGMPVLIAESASRVAQWVEEDEIQAVVGVSCMESLEKAFPSMLRFAVPGIAIPLTRDGCKDTAFDRNTLDQALAIGADAPARIVSVQIVREELRSLFSSGKIARYITATTPYLNDFPSRVAHALCGHGKHYRPMITYMSYAALADTDGFPEFLELIALAVECFHKASLIHDDIEDDDATRYGEPTLHEEIGIPAAINVGDFLIGEGYRLLGHPSVPPDIRPLLTAQAAQAHSELTLGQAQEFESLGKTVSLDQCLETHRLKTAPAFRVALNMGAISARKFAPYRDVFHEFADALGIAYQLLDDLEDPADNPASAIDCMMRSKKIDRETARREIAALYDTYRANTYETLEKIDDTLLKITLYRLTGKVLRQNEKAEIPWHATR